MPELAEVEKARRMAERACAGKTITAVATREAGGGKRDGSFDDIVFCNADAEEFEHALTGRKLVAVHRRGKNLWMQFDKPPHATFHFGMSGAFAVKGEAGTSYERYNVDTSVWPPKFSKLVLTFDNATQLAFTNCRRLGRVRLLDDPTSVPPISDLGFDPLLDMPTPEEFAAAVHTRSLPVKALLLDQSFAAGVGNWIADECLFQARVHPARKCDTLSDEELRAVHAGIKHVVQVAVDADADSSKFPPHWLFHRRWGKGKREKAKGVVFTTVGGRTTAFMPSVQGTVTKSGGASRAKAGLHRSATAPSKSAKRAGHGAGASGTNSSGKGSSERGSKRPRPRRAKSPVANLKGAVKAEPMPAASSAGAGAVAAARRTRRRVAASTAGSSSTSPAAGATHHPPRRVTRSMTSL